MAGELLPPWKQHPEIPSGSIGWRMGYGEDYLMKFDDWYKTLDDEQAGGFRAANPAPSGWRHFYERYER